MPAMWGNSVLVGENGGSAVEKSYAGFIDATEAELVDCDTNMSVVVKSGAPVIRHCSFHVQGGLASLAGFHLCSLGCHALARLRYFMFYI